MPAPYSIADIASVIPSVLQDAAGKLYPIGDAVALVTVLTPYVQRALARYSKDCPLEIVSDVICDGTVNLPLPTYPDVLAGQAVPIFDPLASVIRNIEYPVGLQPPTYIDQNDFRVYRSPAGYGLLLTADSPAPASSARVTWTALHATDGSTVPDKDFFAVVDLSGSFAAQQLATIYTQTGDPIMGADVVNYRTKSQEYQSLAKMLRGRYFMHVGVDESNNGEVETKPAMAIGQQYLEMQSGVDRLVHTRYTR